MRYLHCYQPYSGVREKPGDRKASCNSGNAGWISYLTNEPGNDGSGNDQRIIYVGIDAHQRSFPFNEYVLFWGDKYVCKHCGSCIFHWTADRLSDIRQMGRDKKQSLYHHWFIFVNECKPFCFRYASPERLYRIYSICLSDGGIGTILLGHVYTLAAEQVRSEVFGQSDVTFRQHHGDHFPCRAVVIRCICRGIRGRKMVSGGGHADITRGCALPVYSGDS